MTPRIALNLSLAVFVAGQSAAQPAPEPKDGKVTLSMTLTPSDYPKPASRVYLLPEFRESIPGNRVQMFLRCFMEQDNFFGRVESGRRQKWHDLPLQELPLADVKDYGGRLISRDMYDAARMTNVDWQLWSFIRRDGYNTLLPDVQKMRALADVLKTRARGDIRAGDFDGAIHTLKTLFGLARMLESHPTVIGHLVGVAIAGIGADALEELVQQPGCPNLFWALTDLPRPFLSLRAGLEGERMFISSDFEVLKSAADPVVDSVIQKKIATYEELLRQESGSENPIRDMLNAPKVVLAIRAKNKDEVKAARGRLIQAGLKPEHVAVWSPLHVVLLDDVMLYEQYRDELGKWMNLPYWEAKPGIAQVEAEIAKVKSKSPFTALVPAIGKIKIAQTRLDQRFAYLRIMEAIRLHAFGNGGTLPAALADIKLPLPVDPLTGQPFDYTIHDGVATLHGANPNPGNERTNRYYEIRLRK